MLPNINEKCFFNSICVYFYLMNSPIFCRFLPIFPIRLKLFALLPRQFIANSESGNIDFNGEWRKNNILLENEGKSLFHLKWWQKIS